MGEQTRSKEKSCRPRSAILCGFCDGHRCGDCAEYGGLRYGLRYKESVVAAGAVKAV